MRHLWIWILAASMLPGMSAQAHEPSSEPANKVTFVVLRHAEKATDDPRDPALTESGQQRAQKIAKELSTRDIAAVYSSDYRRTRDTAAASAKQAGLETVLYEPRDPAETFAQQLQDNHPSGVVLIVGHSNTVPALVAALCQCEVNEMAESDYGNWFEVIIDGSERKLVHQLY